MPAGKILHLRKEFVTAEHPTPDAPLHCASVDVRHWTLDVGCWTLGWFPTTRLAHPFHHCFRPTVADDFHALAFVNQLSLRNHIEDFIAELGLAPGPQLRNGDSHLPEARHLFSLELRSRDDST